MKPHFGSDTDSSDEEAPGGEGCQGIAETSGSRTRHWGSSSSEEEEDEEERDEGKRQILLSKRRSLGIRLSLKSH